MSRVRNKNNMSIKVFLEKFWKKIKEFLKDESLVIW